MIFCFAPVVHNYALRQTQIAAQELTGLLLQWMQEMEVQVCYVSEAKIKNGGPLEKLIIPIAAKCNWHEKPAVIAVLLMVFKR